MRDPEPPHNRPERYHAFDSLRAAAMLLGIFYHAGLAYTDPVIDYWPIHDNSRHVGVLLLAWASHGFRMQVFFAMSGFFSALLLGRYGARGFARHRFLRIAIPFALGVVVLDGVVRLFGGLIGESGRQLTAAVELSSPTLGSYLGALEIEHLWFLQYLIFFTAGVLLVAPAARRAFDGRRGQRLHEHFGRLLRSSWKPLWLTPPTAVLMYLQGTWMLDAPTGWWPDVRWMLYYGLFFGFGWLLFGARERLRDLIPQRWRYLGLALPVGLLAFWLARLGLTSDHRHEAWIFAADVLLSSGFTWLAVFGWMGVFLSAFASSRPVVRYLSDSAYWLYLAHVPIVVLFQSMVADTGWPGPAKYLAVCSASLAVLLASYEYLVRYSFIGTLLNGPRTRTRATPSRRRVRARV